MLETASLFVATISALSSIIQAAKAAKDIAKDYDKDINEEAKMIAQVAKKRSNSAVALANTYINEEYIEIAAENIKNALDRFKEVWRDPSSPQAVKDQELKAANYTVCSELKRLMMLNEGELPGDDKFHELWRSHGCAAGT